MNKKYVKVDASKNVNIERLEKYKTRFGYSVSCKNGVETFAVKLDNRLEYIFNNYYKYSLFSEDYVTDLIKYLVCRVLRKESMIHTLSRDCMI